MILINYLKVAWRNLVRNRSSSLINISGLSIGLAVTILMLLYVIDQLSYDAIHQKSDQIYRVISISKSEGGESDIKSNLFAPLAPLLLKNIPEIKEAVRFDKQRQAIVKVGESSYLEENNLFTDPSFFDVFSFDLIQGDPEYVLTNPFSIVITPKIATKYFGNTNPIGKLLTFDNEHTYEVTGIVEAPPANSSIQYDFLLSFSTLYETHKRLIQEYRGGWGMTSFETFLLLQNGSSIEKIEPQILSLIKTQTDIGFAVDRKYKLEVLADVYMRSAADNDLGPSSDIRYVYIFSAAAFLVLLISCFNYTNLATAQFMERAKEVGIRKSAGANRSSLLVQFLGESVITSIFSLLMALILVEVIGIPYLNELLNTTLDSKLLLSVNEYLIFILGISILTGIVAGLYPAFILSRLQVHNIFKNSLNMDKGIKLRKLLVTLQYGLSSGILICTILIHQQLQYATEKKLGLEPDQVIVIPDKGGLDNQEAITLRNQLMQHSGVVTASVSGGMFTKGTMGMLFEGEGVEDKLNAWIFAVDANFDDTFGLKLKSGRFFYDNIQQDVGNSVIINETMGRKFGWEEPLGKSISSGGDDKLEIVGVVEDFHFESLHNKINPVIFIPYDESFTNYISVKFKSGQISEVIKYASQSWENLNKEYPFEYFFLNDSFEELYKSEQNMSSIFNGTTVLTIIIASMGLFGLSIFMARRRTKEIGIRKVLGANIRDILYLLSKDFVGLAGIGFLLAMPISILFMNRWLADFSYRIEIEAWVFIFSGIVMLFITILSVSSHAIRAANIAPVESLRSE